MFYHVSDIRVERLVEINMGVLGLRRHQVTHHTYMHLASGRRLSYELFQPTAKTIHVTVGALIMRRSKKLLFLK